MTPGIQSPFILLLLSLLTATQSPPPSQLTVTTSTKHSSVSPTSSNHITSSLLPSSFSLFFLSFYITNLHFNSSLKDPRTSYYQALQRNVSQLAVYQCRRKSCGQLDIFPTRDAYHPMSEYPTYHTHGRYVPPGSTKRSPYEEVTSGNGSSSLAFTNPAATSADL
ncbi:PREDICTED: mucin-1 [Elephantulus edwardii]|uniref:mucin-1 n=1 Tax=Elephantulus edwardii TaxID=28737 RepID=UPI0003F0D122|nr:PREDICTED: mucin-1 [Elephantulus edwardii]